MAFDLTSPAGRLLLEKLSVWSSEDLERWLQAVGEKIFDPVLSIAEEQGEPGQPGWIPGYGTLFNPDTCPVDWLPWLGQWVGVQVPKVASEAEARALITNEPGLQRGRLATIEAAIRRILGEGIPFAIEERTNANGEEDPYHFVVIVPPGKGSAALDEAINAVKPGGVFYTVVEVEGAWLAGELTWEEVAAGVTWNSVKEGEY